MIHKGNAATGCRLTVAQLTELNSEDFRATVPAAVFGKQDGARCTEALTNGAEKPEGNNGLGQVGWKGKGRTKNKLSLVFTACLPPCNTPLSDTGNA